MATTPPTTEPAFIQAGDTTAWTITLPDYPASAGWVLSYKFINAAGSQEVTAAASGDDHAVTIPASASGDYAPGNYTWLGFVRRTTERYTVRKGTVTVLPDLDAQLNGYESRTPAQKALDDLRAALLQWLSTSGHIQEYEIAGRRMKFATAADIQARIGLAEREVAREKAALRIASGLAPANRIYVRF